MNQKARGFTIVELLVVIVVIGILATITVITYSGIQKRARESRVTLQLTQLRKDMEMYKIEYGKWPFEDDIRACITNAPGGQAGINQCGTHIAGSLIGNDAEIRRVIWRIVQNYVIDNAGNSGSSAIPGSEGWTMYSGSNATGLSPTGEIRFCVGPNIMMDSWSSTTEALYISSQKLGVSPRGNSSWCTN